MKFHNIKIIPFLVIFALPNYLIYAASASDSKHLEYRNRVYKENIKTVILFPADDIKASSVYPAAIPLNQSIPLVLKFDELFTDEAEYYKAKIIHCNMNWEPSHLSEMQYLYEYNEFSIDQFDFSIATKIPFTHFTFRVPKVKLPGNYLLVVYRENNANDLILSRRFIVYDQKIGITGNTGLSSGVAQRNMNQQIEFMIDYTNFPIPNPYLDIQVVIRQNDRWDNAIFGLKPTIIREDVSQLEYRHFNFENNFNGGNEFRFFDIRTTHYGGRNVEKTNISDTQVDAYLFIDEPRTTQPYTFIADLNGGFVIENLEGKDNLLESDYINVHFFLDLKEKSEKDIFIFGKLTDWNYGDINKMKYINASGLYSGILRLKQGLYDFSYSIPENMENPGILEGNHFETKNEYEIIIYFKDQLLGTDIIIGYLKFI